MCGSNRGGRTGGKSKGKDPKGKADGKFGKAGWKASASASAGSGGGGNRKPQEKTELQCAEEALANCAKVLGIAEDCESPLLVDLRDRIKKLKLKAAQTVPVLDQIASINEDIKALRAEKDDLALAISDYEANITAAQLRMEEIERERVEKQTAGDALRAKFLAENQLHPGSTDALGRLEQTLTTMKESFDKVGPTKLGTEGASFDGSAAFQMMLKDLRIAKEGLAPSVVEEATAGQRALADGAGAPPSAMDVSTGDGDGAPKT